MAPDHPSVPVVGLYGISGSGKTTLVNELRSGPQPPQTAARPSPTDAPEFVFREGSELVGDAVPGGLPAFKRLSAADKRQWRESVIRGVASRAREKGEPTVVVGHYMLPEDETPGRPSSPPPRLQSVHTPVDWEAYTHIIYLRVAPAAIAARRASDGARSRPALGVDVLRGWQDAEVAELRRLCREHGIVFTVVVDGAPHEDPAAARVRRLLEFVRCSESGALNLARATGPPASHPACAYEATMGFGRLSYVRHVKVFAFDADRTLAAQDTGNMFWEIARAPLGMGDDGNGHGGVPVLKQVFGGPLGYSPRAFAQAALLYEEAAEALGGGEERFDALCAAVAAKVQLRAEFLSLLQRARDDPLVVPVVVTCGLRRIWQLVLEREGFRCVGGTTDDDDDSSGRYQCTKAVWLVGAGRIGGAHGCQPVVSPQVKEQVVRWMAGNEFPEYSDVTSSPEGPCLNICAFGDSPVDMPMLKAAHWSFVVVDKAREGGTMGKRMVGELKIYPRGGLNKKVACMCCPDPPERQICSHLCRVEFPSTSHKATTAVGTEQEQEQEHLSLMPVVDLTSPATMEAIFPPAHPSLRLLRAPVPLWHATASPAAKLIATGMRDARSRGPALQRAHRKAGEYLAMELLPRALGLEEFPIPHVCQGGGADSTELGMAAAAAVGHRLPHGDSTLIVSLMRGGDPMAQGLFGFFPRAAYLHAKSPPDVRPRHLDGVACVLLVDSVVNSGATVVEFASHVRRLHGAVRVVVVAGVVQADAVSLREDAPFWVLTDDDMQAQHYNMRLQLARLSNVQIVALRVSSNKYKGVGGTDTGNRLFNTTHLDD